MTASKTPLARLINSRPIVLIGLMGAGKSTIGRRLAARLNLPFLDTDQEIETAANMTISDIFTIYGESHFRNGEKKVIQRLLKQGAIVLATGGGAYINDDIRKLMAETAITIWLKAELDVLMKRVRKRGNRPLLQTPDPEATMKNLMEKRYPIYNQADITIESNDIPHEGIVDTIMAALENWLQNPKNSPINKDLKP